jgi:hypothetical protein
MDEQQTPVIDEPMTLGMPEVWEAPDASTAQRWVDEIKAHGGQAEVCAVRPVGSSGPTFWFVHIVRFDTTCTI